MGNPMGSDLSKQNDINMLAALSRGKTPYGPCFFPRKRKLVAFLAGQYFVFGAKNGPFKLFQARSYLVCY
jgi:hypothetical protein